MLIFGKVIKEVDCEFGKDDYLFRIHIGILYSLITTVFGMKLPGAKRVPARAAVGCVLAREWKLFP